MIEPRRSSAAILRATACATKKATRTLIAMTWSKSGTVASRNGAGRLVPALFTRISNAGRLAMQACITARSVTSSGTASAAPPAATIASRAASISLLVRAARTTSAPAWARAAAAVRPRPRPAPVTSARLPSRRKGGVRGISVIQPLGGTVRCARHSAARGHSPARHGRRSPRACRAASNIRRSSRSPRRSGRADR
jgi:hypothetical protein